MVVVYNITILIIFIRDLTTTATYVILVNKGDMIMETELNFADFLKKSMSEKNLNQKQMARATGISQQAISVYLGGEKKPTAGTIHKMARGLDVDLKVLLKYAADPRKENPTRGSRFALSTDENYIIGVFRDIPKTEQMKVLTYVTDIRSKAVQSSPTSHPSKK